MQIFGTVASGIHTSLIIGIDQKDVGLGGPQKGRQAKQKNETRVKKGHAVRIKGSESIGQRKRGGRKVISVGVLEDVTESFMKIGVALLHFFGTLEKVFGGDGEKFLVAHGCVGIDVRLPLLDFTDFAFH